MVGELQCCPWIVGGCDDVAATIGVDLDRRDGLAELNVETRLENTWSAADAVEAVDGDYTPRRQESRAGGEEPDCERPLEAWLDELAGDLLATCLAEGDVDEVDADAEADEVCHLAGGDAGCDLDNDDIAFAGDEQLREGDPVLQSERAHRGDGDGLCGGEGCRRKLGRVQMDPADAEPASRRP